MKLDMWSSASSPSLPALTWLTSLFCLIQAQGGNTHRDILKVIIGILPPNVTWLAVERGFSDLMATGKLPLNADIELLPTDRVFNTTYRDTQAAHAWAVNSTVVIGPFSDIVLLAAEDAKTPYIVLSTPPRGLSHQPLYQFNMLPSENIVHRAVLDVISTYEWAKVAVIYQDEADGLPLIGNLMTLKNMVVKAWRYDVIDSGVLRQHLLDIRQQSMRWIVLVAPPETTDTILREALRLSMLSNRYSWIIVTLKPYELDLTPYWYTQVNMTMFKFVDDKEREKGSFERAISRDAMKIVSNAVSLFTEENGQSCNSHCTNGVMDGSALMPYLNQTHMNGSSGTIQFDGLGHRWNISFSILTLTDTGLDEIGKWQSGHKETKERLKLSHKIRNKTTNLPYPFGHEVVQIVTIEDPPFVMLKKDADLYTGKERYQGYLIDLIEHIAKKLDFQYELYPSPDGNYGSYDEETRQWNGMIRELINGNASMCLGAISITSQREEAVDFTKPFMQKQFNILMKKPKEKTSAFQFLWPLATRVWLITASAMLFVGFLIYIMDKINPNFGPNSENPYGHSPADRFGLRESMWFTYGSLVGAGTEVIPRTTSGRFLTGAWWFFSLILISSYTANLAAFLTVTKIEAPIKSIADLASQTKYKYGTVKNTYANSFFKNSNLEIIRKMWTFMDKLYPDAMVDNTSVGVQMVQNGDYAFIWDAPINRYTTMFECDTMTVGEPFDEKGLGIGVPMGASYRDDISMAILNLGEEGTNQRLLSKWWGGGKCEKFKDTSTSDRKELDLANVAGIFFILAAAAALALLTSILERTYVRYKNKNKQKEGGGLGSRDSSTVALKSSVFLNGQYYTRRTESQL